MSENPNIQPTRQDPIIPPALLLSVAGISFLAAFGLAFTQKGVISIATIAALGIGLASLIAWIFSAPAQFRAFITGRSVRFGGVSILVTILFIVALVAIYSVVKARSWRVDLTQQDTFTLTEGGRTAMASLGADSRIPNIKIYAFYGATQEGRKDQDTLLFDDYKDASNGKVTYEFVDPDKNPVLAQQLKVTRAGQLAIVGNNPDGTQDIEGAQMINFTTQEQLTNAILRVAGTGDFRAYILTVEDGLKLEGTDANGMSQLNQVLKDALSWKTQEVTFADLSNGTIDLKDPLANGIVLVIPGGTSALSDEALQFVENYLDGGGDAVILADVSVEADKPSLATADNLTAYLKEKYGVSFGKDIVLDSQPALGSPLGIFTTDVPTDTAITQSFADVQNASMIFDAPHPVVIEAAAPASVTVSVLANAGNTTFSKTIDQLLAGDSTQADTDPKGPFPVAAMAENSATGSRVVLIGSKGVASNQYAQYASLNVLDLEFSLRSLVWTTKFEDFFATVPSQLQRESRPQDTPIFASTQALTTINLVTVLILPFGTLALGIYVWWSRRARAAKES